MIKERQKHHERELTSQQMLINDQGKGNEKRTKQKVKTWLMGIKKKRQQILIQFTTIETKETAKH